MTEAGNPSPARFQLLTMVGFSRTTPCPVGPVPASCGSTLWRISVRGTPLASPPPGPRRDLPPASAPQLCLWRLLASEPSKGSRSSLSPARCHQAAHLPGRLFPHLAAPGDKASPFRHSRPLPEHPRPPVPTPGFRNPKEGEFAGRQSELTKKRAKGVFPEHPEGCGKRKTGV